MEYIVVFLAWHVINSYNYYKISCSKKAQVTFVEKAQLKITIIEI